MNARYERDQRRGGSSRHQRGGNSPHKKKKKKTLKQVSEDGGSLRDYITERVQLRRQAFDAKNMSTSHMMSYILQTAWKTDFSKPRDITYMRRFISIVTTECQSPNPGDAEKVYNNTITTCYPLADQMCLQPKEGNLTTIVDCVVGLVTKLVTPPKTKSKNVKEGGLPEEVKKIVEKAETIITDTGKALSKRVAYAIVLYRDATHLLQVKPEWKECRDNIFQVLENQFRNGTSKADCRSSPTLGAYWLQNPFSGSSNHHSSTGPWDNWILYESILVTAANDLETIIVGIAREGDSNEDEIQARIKAAHEQRQRSFTETVGSPGYNLRDLYAGYTKSSDTSRRLKDRDSDIRWMALLMEIKDIPSGCLKSGLINTMDRAWNHIREIESQRDGSSGFLIGSVNNFVLSRLITESGWQSHATVTAANEWSHVENNTWKKFDILRDFVSKMNDSGTYTPNRAGTKIMNIGSSKSNDDGIRKGRDSTRKAEILRYLRNQRGQNAAPPTINLEFMDDFKRKQGHPQGTSGSLPKYYSRQLFVNAVNQFLSGKRSNSGQWLLKHEEAHVSIKIDDRIVILSIPRYIVLDWINNLPDKHRPIFAEGDLKDPTAILTPQAMQALIHDFPMHQFSTKALLTRSQKRRVYKGPRTLTCSLNPIEMLLVRVGGNRQALLRMSQKSRDMEIGIRRGVIRDALEMFRDDPLLTWSHWKKWAALNYAMLSKISTLKVGTRYITAAARLPRKLYPYGLKYLAYNHRCMPTTDKGHTPYELIVGSPPKMTDMLHAFGSPVIFSGTSSKSGGSLGQYLGTTNHIAAVIYNPRTGKVTEHRHYQILERPINDSVQAALLSNNPSALRAPKKMKRLTRGDTMRDVAAVRISWDNSISPRRSYRITRNIHGDFINAIQCNGVTRWGDCATHSGAFGTLSAWRRHIQADLCTEAKPSAIRSIHTTHASAVDKRWNGAQEAFLNMDIMPMNDSIDLQSSLDCNTDRGKVIPSKIVLALKIKNGQVQRFKARWVACGNFEKEGANGTYRKGDVAVPVLQSNDAKLIMTIAARSNPPLEVGIFDISAAYLYGRSERPILLRIPAGMTVAEGSQDVVLGQAGEPISQDVVLGQAGEPISQDAERVRRNHVIEVNGNIYGLHSAGAIFNKTLSRELQKQGFRQCRYNTCLYVREEGDRCSLCATYIDDIMICSSRNTLHRIKDDLNQVFAASEGGWSVLEPDIWNEFLGVQIVRRQFDDHVEFEMRAPQKIESLIGNVEAEIGKSVKLTHAPLTPGVNLDKPKAHPENDDVKGRQFIATANGFKDYASFILFMQRHVGTLMYLAHTVVPDIMFAVCYLARRTLSPNRKVLDQIIHLIGYLKTHKDRTLRIGNPRAWNSDVLLHGLSDATWQDSIRDHKSTGGFLIYFLGTLVEAKSYKIKMVCCSSCASEVRTMSTCAQSLLRYNHCLDDIKHILDLLNIRASNRITTLSSSTAQDIDEEDKIFLGGDNTGAIALSKKITESNKTRHIAVHTSFLVQMTTELNLLETYHMDTAVNLADQMTKATSIKSVKLFAPFYYGEDYFPDQN
eukprot:g4441.t1